MTMRIASYIAGFSDELVKIAHTKKAGLGTAGLLIGGGLGSAMSKNKLRGGFVGAVAGGTLGATYEMARKALTEPSARQQFLAQQPTWEPQGYVPTWQRHLAG